MLAGLVATPIVVYANETFLSVLFLSAVVFIVCIELLHTYWRIAIPFWADQLTTTRRETETFSWASISFLLTLVFLVWFTPLPVALAASAMLAFGDGFSALAGRALGHHKIWYNRRKSWEGSAAGFVAGLIGAFLLINWYDGFYATHYPPVTILVVCALGSVFAMVGESLPRVQDNLAVPVFAAVPMTIAWYVLGLSPTWGFLTGRLLESLG